MPWRETPAELERARAEQPVLIGSPSGRLCGIYTPAAPDAPRAGVCVVLLTSPRSHRNRMWVEGARRLATLGFSAMRFDLHGTGDSEGETAFRNPNQPYREDLVAVLRHLGAAFGERRFAVSGVCFDARTALSAFEDCADSIVGLLFIAAPLMELETLVQAASERKGWGHLMHALRKPSNWKSMVRPERWRHAGLVLSRMVRRSVPGGNAAELPLSPGFRRDFDALVRSRSRALFLYGREDSEYESFRVAERELFPRLDAATRARLEVEVWPGRIHGCTEMNRQRESFERGVTWLARLHPSVAAAETARR